jgi:membrane protease YdiL (CAAX protease family)
LLPRKVGIPEAFENPDPLITVIFASPLSFIIYQLFQVNYSSNLLCTLEKLLLVSDIGKAMTEPPYLEYTPPNKEESMLRTVLQILAVTLFSWLILPTLVFSFIPLSIDVAMLLVIQNVVVILPIVIIAFRTAKPSKWLGLRDPITRTVIIVGIVSGVILQFVPNIVGAIYFTFFEPTPVNPIVTDLFTVENIYELMLIFIIIFLVGASVEEIFFRGYVQKRISEVTHPAIAITIASLTFGSLHILTNPFTAVNATVLGVIFGVIYHKTRSIYTTWLSHAVYNSIILIQVFLMFP